MMPQSIAITSILVLVMITATADWLGPSEHDQQIEIMKHQHEQKKEVMSIEQQHETKMKNMDAEAVIMAAEAQKLNQQLQHQYEKEIREVQAAAKDREFAGQASLQKLKIEAMNIDVKHQEFTQQLQYQHEKEMKEMEAAEQARAQQRKIENMNKEQELKNEADLRWFEFVAKYIYVTISLVFVICVGTFLLYKYAIHRQNVDRIISEQRQVHDHIHRRSHSTTNPETTGRSSSPNDSNDLNDSMTSDDQDAEKNQNFNQNLNKNPITKDTKTLSDSGKQEEPSSTTTTTESCCLNDGLSTSSDDENNGTDDKSYEGDGELIGTSSSKGPRRRRLVKQQPQPT